MSANDFDLKGWIADLGVSDEERAQLETILGKAPDRAEKLKGSVLRQSEFSRKMNDLSTQMTAKERALADKEAEIEHERGQLVQWKTGADTKLTDAITKADKLERERFALEQKMRALATDYGVDVSDVLPAAGTPPPAAAPVASALDTSKFIDRDTYQNGVIGMVRTAAQIQKLAAEHRRLFGSELDNPEELVDTVLEAAKKGQTINLQGAWESKFKVADKRRELDEAAVQKRIDDAVKAAEMKVRSEANIATPRPTGAGSPILAQFGKKTPDGAPGGIEGAVQAYNTGKYRPSDAGASS